MSQYTSSKYVPSKSSTDEELVLHTHNNTLIGHPWWSCEGTTTTLVRNGRVVVSIVVFATYDKFVRCRPPTTGKSKEATYKMVATVVLVTHLVCGGTDIDRVPLPPTRIIA